MLKSLPCYFNFLRLLNNDKPYPIDRQIVEKVPIDPVQLKNNTAINAPMVNANSFLYF